ncbi:MAG: T9SS type A sorting domain-containing protein [Ignavibacteriales bacterium]|nr:T9SS type A sorting domain-containing protein [Ignavibacteriales bacterium]
MTLSYTQIRNYLFLFLLCASVHPLYSQQLKWNDISGLQGCYIIREGAQGKLFAVSEAVVYASTDNGNIWEMTSLNRGVMMDFFSDHSNILLVRYISNLTDRYRIELSRDNGLTWQLIYGNRIAMYYDQMMLTPNGEVYAVSDQSTLSLVHFNGIKWDTINNSTLAEYYYCRARAVDKESRIYLAAYGATTNAVLISNDYGNSWEKSLEDLNVQVLGRGQDGAIFAGKSRNVSPKEEGFVYRSTNGGATWDYLGFTDHAIYSLTGDLSGNVYASTEAGIYFYSQSTNRWEFIGPKTEGYDAIVISSNGKLFTSAGVCRSGQCFFPSGNTTPIYSSINNGAFWSSSGPRKQDLFCIAGTNDSGIVAGTLGGRIFRGKVGGLSWIQSEPGTVGDYVYSLSKIDNKIFAGTNEGLFISSDGGVNWWNSTNTNFTGSVFACIKNDSGKLFIGTTFGVYTSADNGLSWSENALYGIPVLFSAAGKNNLLVAVTDEGAVYLSADNGQSWSYSGLTREDVQSIAINENGDLFLGVFGGIMRSTDSGATWNFFAVGTSYVYSISFNSSQNVFIGSYNGVYQSKNNGVDWTFVGLNTGAVLGLIIDSSQHVIAGVFQNGVYRSESPVLDVKIHSDNIPTTTTLYQNYPNPFNPVTEIKFQIAEVNHVLILIYDILGREVERLVDEIKQPGEHSISWNAQNKTSGIYICRMSAGKFNYTRKLALIR